MFSGVPIVVANTRSVSSHRLPFLRCSLYWASLVSFQD